MRRMRSIPIISLRKAKMEQRLVRAAREGDVTELRRIIEEDPQVLGRASSVPFAESALHVAAQAGHVDFVREVLSHETSLAMHTNQKGLIPLHLASAQGHVETVKELLKATKQIDDGEVIVTTTNQCLVRDNEGRTPLHYAVSKGKTEVMKELIGHSPECFDHKTAKEETVLHVAVKANQLKEVVDVIMESAERLPNVQTLLKAKDMDGKTVSDIAAAKKQLQLLEVLMNEDDKKERRRMNVEESESKESQLSISDCTFTACYLLILNKG